MDFLKPQKSQARQRLWEFAQQFPEIQLFKDVPGVGPVMASRFSAYIGDPCYTFSIVSDVWFPVVSSFIDRLSRLTPPLADGP